MLITQNTYKRFMKARGLTPVIKRTYIRMEYGKAVYRTILTFKEKTYNKLTCDFTTQNAKKIFND